MDKTKLRSRFRILLLITTILALLLLAFSICAVYISPVHLSWIVFVPLGLKYLLIINAVFAVIWLFVNYKFAIFVFLCAFAGLKYYTHDYGFIDKSLEEAADFKVMTYNVREFGILAEESQNLRKSVVNCIVEQNPDILCLQEAYWHNKPAQFPTINILTEKLAAKSYYKFTLANFNYGDGGLAIISRYKIINTYTHHFNSKGNGFMYTDLLLGDDTLRVFNCHFQSLELKNTDVNIDKDDVISEGNKEKAVSFYEKYTNAAVKRSYQVDTVCAAIDSSPHPVLVCGDFNDMPLSYTAFRLMRAGNRLHDSFIERGKGNGRTYNVAGLDIRIDYILHEQKYACLRHKVIDFCILNDHYPVVAEFKK